MGTGLFSPTHLVILLLVALLLFGAKRLPEVGRSLGTGMREFKNTVSGLEAGETTQAPETAPAEPAAAPTTQA